MIAPVITLFINPAQESVVGKKQWVQDPQGETWHEEGTSQLLGAPSSWGSHNPPLPPPTHTAPAACCGHILYVFQPQPIPAPSPPTLEPQELKGEVCSGRSAVFPCSHPQLPALWSVSHITFGFGLLAHS